MPSIHIPDKWAYAIVKAGHNVIEFVKNATWERMEKQNIDVEES